MKNILTQLRILGRGILTRVRTCPIVQGPGKGLVHFFCGLKNRVMEISNRRVLPKGRHFVYLVKNVFTSKLSPFFLKLYRQLAMQLRKRIVEIASVVLVCAIPILAREIIWLSIQPRDYYPDLDEKALAGIESKIERRSTTLNSKLDARIPRSYYMVINSSSNEFSLYRGGKLVKTDKCSTGSYTLLKNGDDQEWMFKTPKGEFRIQGKTTSPVWRKPDWAFVEEGLPVPSATHPSRYEFGVLGDYALSLGHGYLIHGTLYQRFLGLPVTHGCIRLNDENLELVYRNMQIGSKVYIY